MFGCCAPVYYIVLALHRKICSTYYHSDYYYYYYYYYYYDYDHQY